jgi:hypothetical protein
MISQTMFSYDILGKLGAGGPHKEVYHENFTLHRSIQSVFGKCNSVLTACISFLSFTLIAQVSPASAQGVLFDFDNAPVHTSLPISQTVSGITAHFSATGQGYSIQAANTMGFTPQGFAGNCIYPNSINLSDLLIRFDQTLTDFSIMYSVQELACDTSATMRVTAYMNGGFVGTNTKVASHPGTWPVDTLRCSFTQGFDSVVVHYDSHPPTCQDYGVIYLADNMRVTPFNVTAVSEGEFPELFILSQNYPNPFNPSTTIDYRLLTQSQVTLKVFDLLGRDVATLVHSVEQPGYKTVNFNANNLASGVYYCRLQAGKLVETRKLVLLR